MTYAPELLLPVGNMDMALAAIHNGANAIYVGMPGFNARGRTHDHSFTELAEIIEICHLYNVEVHVAFNILIFQDELAAATASLIQVLELHPDALIVQDIGLIKLIKTIAPSQVIHGSTQMTVTNYESIELLEDLDIKRFVLGRENSLPEIAKIKEKTNKELEVFVHGALCVAYSGQCFTSEALGGRSANRGQCAQSCRFEYELFVDNKKKNLVDKKYLVSPQDLCGIDEIPKLVEMGVESFKVEGRLKGPEYVSSVAANYRSVIDGLINFDHKLAKEEMELTFSRGFYPGWLNGVAHQELVEGTSSSKRGVLIGTVISIKGKTVYIGSDTELTAGDGVLFVSTQYQLGGNIYQVTPVKSGYHLQFAHDFEINKIKPNQKVYLSSRKKLYKELNKSYTQKDKLKRLPISVHLSGKLGSPLKLTASEGNNTVEVISENNLEVAKSQELTTETLKATLSGLSHTPYIISIIEADLVGRLFIHNKELKKLKQQMVASLNKKRLARPNFTPLPYSQDKKQNYTQKKSKLSILVRKIEQVEALKNFIEQNNHYKAAIQKIIVDFEFGKDFTKAIKDIKEMGIESVIATTRILKPNEYHNFRLIERANPDGILIRNLGALNYFKQSEFNLYGDFSLNATNSVTFNYLVDKGLTTLCASYDMSAKQLDDLLEMLDPSIVEITVHQYMPEFHMEHCVFAAFLSQGNSFKDCGKPCEKHSVYLKDMYGNQHEIKADQECRNTMFRSVPQSAAMLLPQWQKAGVSNFRFEALHEDDHELITKLQVYLDLIQASITPEQAYQQMDTLENYGVSTGQLLNKKTYKDRKTRS